MWDHLVHGMVIWICLLDTVVYRSLFCELHDNTSWSVHVLVNKVSLCMSVCLWQWQWQSLGTLQQMNHNMDQIRISACVTSFARYNSPDTWSNWRNFVTRFFTHAGCPHLFILQFMGLDICRQWQWHFSRWTWIQWVPHPRVVWGALWCTSSRKAQWRTIGKHFLLKYLWKSVYYYWSCFMWKFKYIAHHHHYCHIVLKCLSMNLVRCCYLWRVYNYIVAPLCVCFCQ